MLLIRCYGAGSKDLLQRSFVACSCYHHHYHDMSLQHGYSTLVYRDRDSWRWRSARQVRASWPARYSPSPQHSYIDTFTADSLGYWCNNSVMSLRPASDYHCAMCTDCCSRWWQHLHSALRDSQSLCSVAVAAAAAAVDNGNDRGHCKHRSWLASHIAPLSAWNTVNWLYMSASGNEFFNR